MEMIPAIDLIGGKCVRLSEGDFSRMTTYNNSPLDMAMRVQDAGLGRLHIVDLDGAKAGKCQNLNTLEKICLKTDLMIDYGGGVSGRDLFASVLDAGARMVSLGSLAVKQPQLLDELIRDFGPERIFLGADVRLGRIAISGWKENTSTDLMDFLALWVEKGIINVFVTDISRDGMLRGPATDMYKGILKKFPSIKLSASGGITSGKDLETLQQAGLYGAIVGKAIYEGHLSLGELAKWGANAG